MELRPYQEEARRAVEGDWENGLFFCGGNAGEVNRLSTVREQMDQIMNEWRTAP